MVDTVLEQQYMLSYLLNNALDGISLTEFSTKVLCALREFSLLHAALKRKDLTSYSEELAGSSAIPIEPQVFADLVWRVVSRNHPAICLFPLGDAFERSVKRTVTSVLLSYPQLGPPKKAKERFTKQIFMHAADVTQARLKREFLSNLLYTLCMSAVRSKTAAIDLGYAYQYRNGHLVPASDQKRLREQILTNCGPISDQFVDNMKNSDSEKAADGSVRKISGAFRKALPFVNWNEGAVTTDWPINIVVGAAPRSLLSSQFSLDTEFIRINLEGKGQNVTFDLSVVESFVGHTLNPLTADLLEIAFAVYVADVCTPRGSDYSRRLCIAIPVRHPGIWESTSKNLENAVSFLGRDNVSFHFFSKRKKLEEVQEYPEADERKCCCLFSGGVDSAAGVVWSFSEGLRPILVSYSPGNLSGIQRELAERVREPGTRKLPHLIVSWQPSKKKRVPYRLPEAESGLFYQHLRSFFYLALGYSVALETGCRTVYMFENGPVSINPLLSESAVNTRTAHPVFLDLFRLAMDVVFDLGIDIGNPFMHSTKGQLVRFIKKHRNPAEIIPYTSSCYSYARVKTLAHRLDRYDYVGTHDGDCLPCLNRRVAIATARLAQANDEHLIDVFDLLKSSAFLRFPERSLNTMVEIADLLRFCESILVMSDQELQFEFPDLFYYSPRLDCAQMAVTYRRYAKETIDCFRKQSSKDLLRVWHTVLKRGT